MNRDVVIIGGGPAGSSLAIYLLQRGTKVTIFDRDTRPDLIVGESLVPLTTTSLKELDIEKEVCNTSIRKNGAAFFLDSHSSFEFKFANAPKPLEKYAYNVDRSIFDEILLNKALSMGAYYIKDRAKLRREKDRIFLADESLALLPPNSDTDRLLFVDASGRSRVVASLLNLPYSVGERNDTALFCHLNQCHLSHDNYIHINRLNHGWAWRIPLQNKVSLGIVVPNHLLADSNRSDQDFYDHFLSSEPTLSSLTQSSRRITRVAKYSNYQLLSERWFGENWALLGDSGGFVDPIFSSGLMLALKSARLLSQSILSDSRISMKSYQAEMINELLAWRRFIKSFYDGRLFTLFRLRKFLPFYPFGPAIERRITKELGLALGGMTPLRWRDQSLMRILVELLLRRSPYHRFRIES